MFRSCSTAQEGRLRWDVTKAIQPCVGEGCTNWVKGRQLCGTCTGYKYPRKRLGKLVDTARARAKKKGKEFDLTIDWVVAGWSESQACRLCGAPMELNAADRERSPSIDRVNSAKGYTKDNCQLTHTQCNTAKGAGGFQAHWSFTKNWLKNMPDDVFHANIITMRNDMQTLYTERAAA
jgi:hypothetical protein